MKNRILEVPGTFVTEVLSEGNPKPKRIILLLHGFEQSGKYIADKLEPAWREFTRDDLIVAANGPYPIPRKEDRSFRVGFSWYFYDPYKDEYFIDMKPAVEFVKGLLGKLGVADLPLVLVGFSQGGYFAPFLAQELPNIRQVIGIGCQFLHEELDPSRLRHVRLDGIHGSKDEVVDPEPARQSWIQLHAAGIEGSFEMFEGVGHRMEDHVCARVRALLKESENGPLASARARAPE